MSFSKADGGTSVEPPGRTVGDILRAAARRSLDAEAFVIRDGSERSVWTFDSLLRDASSLARWLIAAAHADDPVALWSPNSADVVLVQMAVALAGLVLVPMNPNLRPDEVAHVLRVSGAGADPRRGPVWAR